MILENRPNAGSEKELLGTLEQDYEGYNRLEEISKNYRRSQLFRKNDLFFRNILLNESEIRRQMSILSSRPRALAVTLTNRCNLNCIMCTAKENKWEIPRETLQQIKEAFPYLEFIMWRGGEVFLVDYFEDLLEVTKDYPNMKQLIITNGLLLSPNLIKKLVLQPELVLVFSIDSIKKKVYEEIRRGSKFDTLIENLELIKTLRKECNANITLNLNMVVMEFNYKEIKDFIEFARIYGFETVLFAPPSGENCSKINVFRNGKLHIWNEVQRSMDYIARKAMEYNIKIDNRLPNFKNNIDDIQKMHKKRAKFLCYAPWLRLCINWGGDVYPDCLCLNPQKGGVGNVKYQSIQDIWNGEGMQLYRRKLITNDFGDLCNPACISGQIYDRYLMFNR